MNDLMNILQSLQNQGSGITVGGGYNLPAEQPRFMPEPPINGFDETQAPMVNTGNISNYVREALGEREPVKPNKAMGILSQRFQGGPLEPVQNAPESSYDYSGLPFGTSYGDYAQGVVQSAMGKPQLGTQIAQTRTKDLFGTLAKVQELDNQTRKLDILSAGGSGGTSVYGQIMSQLNSDPSTANLPLATKISIAKNGLGLGNTLQGDTVTPINGFGPAKGAVKFAEGRGSAAGKASIENVKTASSLQNLDSDIQAARALIPKVSMTGPILGRAGAAANDPDYANLQGSLNGIVLQAKELYNLGSGQGFSDADRDFLQDVVAGKYSRAETISLALDRMQRISKSRQQFLNKQNQSMGQEFGYPVPGQNNNDPLGIR